MKIEVTGQVVGRTFGDNTYYSQEAYIHKDGAKYPEKMNLSVESGNKAYALGFYTLNLPLSTYIGQYDALSFSRYLVLTPEK